MEISNKYSKKIANANKLCYNQGASVKACSLICYIALRKGILMSEIIRCDVNEEWAHTGIIKAGEFFFLNYCVGNVGDTIEQQIHGAFDEMEKRLAVFD